MNKHLTIVLVTLAAMISTSSMAGLPTHDSQDRALPSLAPMLKNVNPAVVNIATYSTQQALNPLLNDPFFQRFFDLPSPEQQPQQRPQKRKQSAGSGVIIDAQKGIVITNYHVIKGAEEVEVSLVDGRTYKASITGVDPELDVAVLTINAKNLMALTIGDSSQLQVGDFVVAIGNPFGLGQTVTTGIVSALERTGLGIEGYENFIQTDASINPGNSGGALVNLHGELIGINTAIIAPSGGNVGIGFAIPVNMVDASMKQIIKSGKVSRGQIGVSIQDITPDLRKAFDLKNGQQGVLVSGVTQGSPAEKAGLKAGDVIMAINQRPTLSAGQLRSQIAILKIGDEVLVSVMRDDKPKEFKVKIAEPLLSAAVNGALHNLLEGATFESNTKGGGVLVSKLEPNSPASFSGLRQGDVIVGANRIQVNTLQEFQKALQRDPSKVLLHISRGGGSFYLVIR